MPSKKIVHKLKLDFDIDFQLIGIASHENDYRLSWAINKALNLELAKTHDLIVNHPKHKIEIGYSLYHFEDELEYLSYSLISNKSENGFLLPEKNNIDFILKVSGSLDINILNLIIRKLNNVEIVLAAFLLDDISDKMWKAFSF